MRNNEDIVMEELWRIKEELSEEMEGKSFEELKQWLEEGKRLCEEKARKFKEREVINKI